MPVSAWFSEAAVETRLQAKFWHWFQSDVAHEGAGTLLRPIRATFTQSGDIISQIHTPTVPESPLARQN